MRNNENCLPREMQNSDNDEALSEQQQQSLDSIDSGIPFLSINPKEMAGQAFEAVKRGEVYFNDPSSLQLLTASMNGIVKKFVPPKDPLDMLFETQNQE